jgi:hypothetical protein
MTKAASNSLNPNRGVGKSRPPDGSFFCVIFLIVYTIVVQKEKKREKRERERRERDKKRERENKSY